MLLLEIIKELEIIKTDLVNSKKWYCSHYIFEKRCESVVEKFNKECENSSSQQEQVDRCKSLIDEITVELKKLEKANETMILALDFDSECKKLINEGDLNNLKGLVGIGEYFGVKSEGGREISGALDHVLRFYQLSAKKRTTKNKPCLDYLCNILGHPILEVPTNDRASSEVPRFSFGLSGNSTAFQNPQDRVKDILKKDSTTDLMIWLLHASIEDRHFALRVASSQEGSFDCLRFLLLRADPLRADIDILTQGKPSLQCAMHRAIQSRSAVIISTMLASDINRSNDLLRQLLVQDKEKETPIDYLSKISDCDEYSLIVRTIRHAVEEHQRDERLALTADEEKNVTEKLSALSHRAPAFTSQ